MIFNTFDLKSGSGSGVGYTLDSVVSITSTLVSDELEIGVDVKDDQIETSIEIQFC